jgi:hypothetical protein
MKITVESTDKVVNLFRGSGQELACRIWEGYSENGVPVQCMIVRVAAPVECNQAEFEHDLEETRPPQMQPEIFPLRLVL